ncbi:DNA mismatch repair protein MutS [Phycisphaerae bacterium RAS1]|nr:DNA mismatch repair protein MutS [Phycisphaerae bacterium RAS1]
MIADELLHPATVPVPALAPDQATTSNSAAALPLPAADALTPAMRQYVEQKRQAGDAILLFRMGDFYEMFFDDAVRAAKLLGIALTSRDGGRTPLAGIPYHALDSYLGKLVAAGCKVAISEQIEDARQAKGVVRRAIVRIVTPGTLTDDALLDQSRSNILAAAARADGRAGLAWLELSTGRFDVQQCDEARLIDEIGRLAPAEVLLPDSPHVGRDDLETQLRERLEAAVTRRSPADFAAYRADELLRQHFQTATLEGFGFEQVDLSLQAAGALLAYVLETQKSAARHLQPPRRRQMSAFMALDPTTLRALEVERCMRTAGRAGSLLAAVDRTCNPMGARLLRNWLCYPLLDPRAIERRQSLIAALREQPAARTALRQALRDTGDIERMVGRLGVQRISPRDMRSIGEGLLRLPSMRQRLGELHSPQADELLARLGGLDELAQALSAALRPDAPITLREGDIFADGWNAELDRLRLIGRDGQRWLAEFQARETTRAGIPIKVGYNRVFGYYIEISHAHRDRAPADYVRRQTVKNAERYITDELKRYETEALSAQARGCDLEYELFCDLRERLAQHIPALQRVAAALAELDVLAGWADLSLDRRYCRPEFVDEPLLQIEEGRHPVVEQALEAGFVANETGLGARDSGAQGAGRRAQAADDSVDAEAARAPRPTPCALALITGPNMAGKSTYIRQVALLTLLAHCGCWVPARRMQLGPVDRIFTRVGAADELSRGQSTFMVEMLETANILHNATPRSLVILDEIGRGTSTFDGLSLAWAITEHLAGRVGCRALFATHYHELTELAELVEGVSNLNVAVREFEDQVVFLHRIVEGPADRSYGLHVAKLAGVPQAVLERANAVLSELEKNFGRETHRPVLAAVQRRRQRQLRLFEEPEEAIVRQLRELPDAAVDAETALGLLKAWRALLRG